MYLRGSVRLWKVAWGDRWSLLGLGLLAVTTEVLDDLLPRTELFSVTYAAVFSTALSIFLVFRFNEAYERWWEARKLWGRLVNLSRDLARQALALFPGDAGADLARALIQRQIAYVNALRIQLRQGASPRGRRQMQEMLQRLVPDEAETLLARDSIPLALLESQSRLLAATLRDAVPDAARLVRLDRTLSELVEVQGGCERIKNTPFPEMVTVVTRILVWGMAALLFLATMGPELRDGIVPTIAVAAMAMGYIWIDSMGRDLKDPFENGPSDTPMTALCLTIERDLRQMLGDADLPEPARPVRGILM